jgi:TolB-like protein
MPDSPVRAVFISHASQDAEAARSICDGLRSGGIEVWFDSDGGLEHGDEWDVKIRRQIKECVLFIPIISSATQARHEGYFRIEWDLAAERSRGFASGVPFVLPVVIDETREPEALVPDRFRSVQWTRLPGGRVSPEFLSRFLKLWSHRTGVLAHEAALNASAAPARAATMPAPSGKKPIKAILAALVVIVAAAVGLAYWMANAKRTAMAQDSAVAVAEQKPQESGPLAPDPKSVAVLSFENLSDDKENEYFSDGISEELLNVLSKIPGLHVAARTSSFYFKGKNATAQDIGSKLGVANLVEGSVRRSGNSVRISARLSRAATGEQLWSESYTRDLSDVFLVQTELAQTIVAQLRQQLGVSVAKEEIAAQVQAAEKGGTTNVEAHRLYLEGKFYLYQTSIDSIDKGAALLRRAVDLDPNYALAWAALSKAGDLTNGLAVTKEDVDRGLELARSSAEHALQVAPDFAAAYLAESDVQQDKFDWKGAAASLRKAKQLDPENSDVLESGSVLAMAFGETDRAIDLGRRAEALDPVNPNIKAYLALSLCAAGRIEEARVEAQDILSQTPGNLWGHGGLAYCFTAGGRFDQALKEANLGNTEWLRLVEASIAQWGLGMKTESNVSLNRLIEVYADVAAYQVAEAYAFRNDPDSAFQWLERAHRQRDPGLQRMKLDIAFLKIHLDPRWGAFLTTMGLADGQVDSVEL